MKSTVFAALAAVTLLPLPAVQAQQQRAPQASIEVTAVGEATSALSGNAFTLRVRNMTYTVSYTTQGLRNRVEVRRGDTVRVVGEITEANRIMADQVQVLNRGGAGGGIGGPSRQSTVVTGTIRSIDRNGGVMFVNAPPDNNLRVTWGDDVEFYRNTSRSNPREFRQGDQVRIVGRRVGNEFRARRVLYGGKAGWTDGAIGEVVGLDARDKEAEIDFDGEIWVVRLNNATIRRNNQRVELSDLRLGQDVRVYGTARGNRALDASRVEVVRNSDNANAGRNDDREVFEGRILNVAEGRKAFRVDARGQQVRIVTTDDTNFFRGNTRTNFNSLKEGLRVRVTARRQGEDWVANRVELL